MASKRRTSFFDEDNDKCSEDDMQEEDQSDADSQYTDEDPLESKFDELLDKLSDLIALLKQSTLIPPSIGQT